MSRDPFLLPIGQTDTLRASQVHSLDFDQSSVDPRFSNDPLSEERAVFPRRVFRIVIVAAMAVIILQLIRLQLFDHQKYLLAAEGSRLRTQYVLAPRGQIIDSHQKIIATNKPSFELVVTPLDLPSDANALGREVLALSSLFSLDQTGLDRILSGLNRTSFLPITLAQNVAPDSAIVFITRQSEFPGFSLQNNPIREYIDGPIFAPILGYTGKLTSEEYGELAAGGYIYNDVVGKQGLELEYEKYLRGEFGQRVVEVDASGSVKNSFQEKPAAAGAQLDLFLDSDLQRVLYVSLQKQLSQTRAKRAAAVAIDPKTGGVLALVSLPSFDNNLFARGISSQEYQELLDNPDFPLFNRPTSGTYPPGSTVKPLIASAALQEGTISEKTKIYDGGKIEVPNQFNPNIIYTFHGWKPEGLGSVDVYDAIAESSDIYFYTVGGGQKNLGIAGLGPQTLASYLKKFFLGQITGIDLPTEKAGLIPSPDWKAQRFAGSVVDAQWFLGDTYNMSIGQGFVSVTPLQLALATAALGNGGTVWRPHLVEQVQNEKGEVLYKYVPQVLNKDFINSEYLQIARQGMRRAVTDGTARLLSTLAIEVAGKTGTSQFDGSDPRKTHAWFTSFAPYENPSIALTILIESGGEGNAAAVPVAREVYDWYSKNRMK